MWKAERMAEFVNGDLECAKVRRVMDRRMPCEAKGRDNGRGAAERGEAEDAPVRVTSLRDGNVGGRNAEDLCARSGEGAEEWEQTIGAMAIAGGVEGRGRQGLRRDD